MHVQAIRYPDVEAERGKPDCELRFVTEAAPVERQCVLIGDVFVGDRGFSTNCGVARVRREVRKRACEMGGEVARIHDIRDWMSNCSQVRAMVYDCSARAESDAGGDAQ